MANEIDYSKQLKEAIAKRREYEKQLSSGENRGDVKIDVKRLQADIEAQTALSEMKKQAWYQDTTKTEPEVLDKGALAKVGKFFDKFNIPLRAVVGAAESLTGKGDVDGFIANVKDNIKEGGDTFGNLLEKWNMPFAKPIGFIADLTLDPLNLVGGLGVASKLAKAGKIGSAGKVLGSQLIRSVPDTITMAGKLATGIAGAPLKIANKFIKGGEDTLIGKAISKVDDASKFMSSMGAKVDNFTNNVADTELQKIGSSSLNYLIENSKKGGIRRDQINDFMEKIPGVGNVWRGFKSDAENYYSRKLIESDLKNGTIADSNRMNFALNAVRKNNINNVKPEDLYKITDAEEALRLAGKDSNLAYTDNPDEFYKAMGYEAQIDQIAKENNYIKKYEDLGVNKDKVTHIKWYDDTQAKVAGAVQKSPKFKALAGFFDGASAWFKTAKLANPASIVNNYLGSFGLVGMSGMDVFNKEFLGGLGRLTKARYTGQDTYKVLEEIFSNNDLVRFVETNPKIAESVFNIDPQTVKAYKEFKGVRGEDIDASEQFDKTLKKGMKGSLFSKVTGDLNYATIFEDQKMTPEMSNAIYALLKKTGKPLYIGNNKVLDITNLSEIKDVKDINKYIRDMELGDEPLKLTGSENLEEIGKKMGIPSLSKGLKGSLDELIATKKYRPGVLKEIPQEAKQFIEKMKEFGSGNTLGSKTVRGGARQLEKLMEGFGAPDQLFRLNTLIQMTTRGLSMNEINNLAKTYKFDTGEIMRKGDKYFVLPEKAVDIVSDIYINYDAMPAAVKMLRNLPILGAPFAAFSSSAAQKAAKAIVRNPEFFSHMESLQNELGGTITPLEEEAMKSKYYQYIKDGDYIKLPFFKDNPIFLSMTNFLPYYAFNNMADEGRGYTKEGAANIISAMDKLPIMKDPIGSTIFDYFIQPLILKDTQDTMKGSFGQTLAPKDATLGEKAFYGTRSLMEAYFPTAAGIFGVPASLLTGGALSEQLVPGMERTTLEELAPSYRFRQLYNAVQGKSAIGVEGKEEPIRRTFRNLAGFFGLPTATMDTSYIEGQTKKEITK